MVILWDISPGKRLQKSGQIHQIFDGKTDWKNKLGEELMEPIAPGQKNGWLNFTMVVGLEEKFGEQIWGKNGWKQITPISLWFIGEISIGKSS